MKTENDTQMIALATQIRPTQVVSTESYKRAAKQVVAARMALEYFKARKEELTQPLKQMNTVVAEWFGPSQDRLETIEAELKAEMTRYIDAAIPQASKAAWDAFEAGDRDAAREAMVAVPAVEGIQIRTETELKIDLDLLPDEYFDRVPNEKRIRAALKKRVDVPGVVCRKRSSLAISTSAARKAQQND